VRTCLRARMMASGSWNIRRLSTSTPPRLLRARPSTPLHATPMALQIRPHPQPLVRFLHLQMNQAEKPPLRTEQGEMMMMMMMMIILQSCLELHFPS